MGGERGCPVIRRAVKFYDSLTQACTTYGPWAKCCPQKLLIWPAKPQILFILLFPLVKTPFERVKTYQLCHLDMSKKILVRHEI